MISETEALERILAALPGPVAEPVSVDRAAGRCLAEDIQAAHPLPGFDNAAMDGFALHADDCGRSGVRLVVSGEQPAGPDRALTVQPGQAVRIFTGAPLPGGTAAVVMQEDTVRDGDAIVLTEPVDPGEFIRRAGSDLCRGQWIARRGQRIAPALAGLIAAQGIATVHCGRKPRVGILCSGGELVPAGQSLPAAGYLYNSNGPMLSGLLAGSGVADPGPALQTPDVMAEVRSALRVLTESCDAILLAGGLSVGDHDLVRPALAAEGATTDFWRVAVRPGKPFLFGHMPSGLPVFGLPGNPVSALVTTLLFVLPALRHMAGAADTAWPMIPAIMGSDLRNPGDRPHWIRGQFDPSDGVFHPAGLQESHALASLARASALVRLPPGSVTEAGSRVRVLLLEG
jgi:molybdopterin molybdotransferase